MRTGLYSTIVISIVFYGLVFGTGFHFGRVYERHHPAGSVQQQAQIKATTHPDSIVVTTFSATHWDTLSSNSELNDRLLRVESEVRSFKKHIRTEWNEKNRVKP